MGGGGGGLFRGDFSWEKCFSFCNGQKWPLEFEHNSSLEISKKLPITASYVRQYCTQSFAMRGEPLSQDIQDSCAYFFLKGLSQLLRSYMAFEREKRFKSLIGKKGKSACRILVWRHTTSGSPSSSSFAWGWSRCPGIYGHDPQDADHPPPPCSSSRLREGRYKLFELWSKIPFLPTGIYSDIAKPYQFYVQQRPWIAPMWVPFTSDMLN